MGSDRSSSILFEAVLTASKELDSATILHVFATEEVVNNIRSNPNFSSSYSPSSAKIEFHFVQDVIHMTDEPLEAIRRKKNSSLLYGMRFLKKRQIDAFVSAGNTGALIAAATVLLAPLPSIKRSALLANLPTAKGSVAVIDVGGNVACKSHHLIQFASMGASYQRLCHGIERPRVGLLNIGVESKKGTSELRQVYEVLSEGKNSPFKQQQMEFIGNVEGREVFQGAVDVLVTDGFTGNVFLKTSEGLSSFILDLVKDGLGASLSEQHIEGLFSHLKSHFNYEEYPGAILCGVDGVVVKCHGESSARGVLNGIRGAIKLVRNQFIDQLKQQLTIDPLSHQLDYFEK